MANGAMFGDITSFVEQKYLTRIRRDVCISQTAKGHEITLYACVEADAYDELIYQPDSWDETNMASLLSYIQQQAVQFRDIGITPEDTLIGLSTCAEGRNNGV